jgi:hypothetical protein
MCEEGWLALWRMGGQPQVGCLSYSVGCLVTQLLLGVINSLLVSEVRCDFQAVMTMHCMLVYFAHLANS